MGYVSTAIDVTGQKLVQPARQGEMPYGAVLDATIGNVAVVDCAGRIVGLLDGERTDAAVASAAIARAYPTAWEGVNARTYGPPGLEDDLRWCTQENTLAVVPRFTRMVGPAAEVER